jgi:hypothetical protein
MLPTIHSIGFHKIIIFHMNGKERKGIERTEDYKLQIFLKKVINCKKTKPMKIRAMLAHH